MRAKCVHLNWKTALLVLFGVVVKGVEYSDPDNGTVPFHHFSQESEMRVACPSGLPCNKLSYPCIVCNLSTNCTYGAVVNTTCYPEADVDCTGPKQFDRTYQCKYCYQTDPKEYLCHHQTNCQSVASPNEYYKTNCTVFNDVICLGKREFFKKIRCNWTSGYKWSTTLLLSITLGGFGADRFYLGQWQEGIGKLFSFGGLGVWTLIDVLLISLHYLGPADGSLYI